MWINQVCRIELQFNHVVYGGYVGLRYNASYVKCKLAPCNHQYGAVCMVENGVYGPTFDMKRRELDENRRVSLRRN